ncbi:MAG TPA: alanine racemase [Solirubrobacteraceae bacterium]|jgi:alanine racemase
MNQLTAMEGGSQRVRADVNLAAIERNCARLRAGLADDGLLCAVVKADGYGHGALPCARAALAGGAAWLAVSSAQELRELREAPDLHDVRVLVMGALTPVELVEALAAGGDVVVWSERYLEGVLAAGGGRVHVKFDSGMGRLGTRDPEEAMRVARAALAAPEVELAGLMTHFATADDLHDGGFFAEQLATFTNWSMALKHEHPELIVHAANSAGLLRERSARFDMARCGIAIYGMDPFGEDPAARALEPALSLGSYVAEVKRCAPGESAGYGRRFVAERDTYIGLLPLGYGDGWRRGLSNNADVLVGGRRHPSVGTVSMDSITLELGPGEEAESLKGEPAVLIGLQGGERITAEELARRLDTINYEITCGLTSRVPRTYHRDGIEEAGR